jgi:hypothetical protein
MIKSIRIINVRGISDKTFMFHQPEMHPNKVHLLVASNGFGKSSISTAFESLNSARMVLKERDFHCHEEFNKPQLIVTTQNGSESIELVADQTKNEIAKTFDLFVIRGARKVKASQRPTATGFQVPVGEFVIEPIELCKVPEKVEIAYKYRETVKLFGDASKVAPNMSGEINKLENIEAVLNSKFGSKYLGKNIASTYDSILTEVRSLIGKPEVIEDSLEKIWFRLKDSTPEFIEICEFLRLFDLKSKKILGAIQLIDSVRQDLKISKSALKWLKFERNFERAKNLISSSTPNSAWVKTEVKKQKDVLVILLPKPESMSNGQRDFLFFVSQLVQFTFEVDKRKAILIIDEIFDYLDHANILVCQYFLKKFIDLFSDAGSQIYPLILTHLDPSVFNSFVFSKKVQKNHYLDGVVDNTSDAMLKIIQSRKEDDFEKIFGNFHAHHSLTECEEKVLFEKKGLKTNWGCSKTFKKYCSDHLSLYISDGNNIDYLAVCMALRIAIEKNACDQLKISEQQEFTSVRRTINKLEYAKSKGAVVPELHYLLAALYNSALHTESDAEGILTPVVTKLKNCFIRDMVKEIASGTGAIVKPFG